MYAIGVGLFLFLTYQRGANVCDIISLLLIGFGYGVKTSEYILRYQLRKAGL